MAPSADPSSRSRIRTVVIAAVVVAAASLFVVLSGDDADDDVATAPTTEPAAATDGTTAPGPDISEVTVYPPIDSTVRFDDPVGAAEAFATDFLGFSDPIVGELREGDARSGEVGVQPTADGPETTVLVRQLEDQTWWVIGATTETITVTNPESLETVSSPLVVEGDALAFEGTVEVTLWADGGKQPLATGVGTGGGSEMSPYEVELVFDPPDGLLGSIVVRSYSAEDGSVWMATALPVYFPAT